ncbi:MAG TPA: hypothetical protein VHH36_05320, partial [Candidatus Thermoplasmatota archaeon]|nr:hypothetical protein [Candidatus Thermoplasmatota archaeon]
MGRQQEARLRLQDRAPDLEVVEPREGEVEAPGEREVEEDAHGVDVRARVGLGAAHLLGAHVDERAQPRRERRRRVRGGAGDAEVRELHLALAREEDVLGLHVEVRDAARVRRRERVEDPFREAHALDGPHAAAPLQGLREVA